MKNCIFKRKDMKKGEKNPTYILEPPTPFLDVSELETLLWLGDFEALK